MNTMDDLVETEKRMAHIAKQTIDEDKEFIPMMEVIDEDGGRILIVLADLFNEEMRHQKRAILRMVLAQHKAVSYVMASEAWMVALDSKTDEPPKLERPIRDDDRRMSVVVINGENRNGDLIFSTYKINEKKPRIMDEKPYELQTYTKNDPHRTQGNHVGLLEGIFDK